ncbi:MAG: lipopolysaccharide biosynthesis protein [Calditrichaceae bacterium]|nr:lipopolysaccharide biosynthesis protein [Calditrichaceae bacterium]MBN2707481.1 lipopolysaccharide biosynthesis protein [Calditrichaceae bacterium]RQV95571.1 MAG: lipopolysaccharide biosynthesis protein [Calditrichota bacterium]
MITNLKEQTIKSFFWVFNINITMRILSFIRIVILARILNPDDFGLFGIALITVSIIEQLTQTGFQTALIQKDSSINDYYNVYWTTQVLRSFVISFILFFIAPLIASFFNEPRSINLIRIFAFTIIIRSFVNPAILILTKELQFNKKYIYQTIPNLIDFIITVIFAFYYRNVWALIFGLIGKTMTSLILSYIIVRHTPKFDIDFSKMRELSKYGRWVFLNNLIGYLCLESDKFFVSKIFGTISLGFYQIGYRFSNLLTSEITQTISAVTFPAYSKIQNEKAKLKQAFLKSFRLITFISLPIAILTIYFAKELIIYILGEKWLPAINILRFLVLAGIFRSISAIWGSLYYATGVPKYDFIKNFCRLIIILSSIFPLLNRYGTEGAAISVFLGSIFTIIFDLIYIKYLNTLDLNLKELKENFIFNSISASFLVAFILMINYIFSNIDTGIIFTFCLIFTCIIIYIFPQYLFKRKFKIIPFYELMETITSMLKSFKLKAL